MDEHTIPLYMEKNRHTGRTEEERHHRLCRVHYGAVCIGEDQGDGGRLPDSKQGAAGPLSGRSHRKCPKSRGHNQDHAAGPEIQLRSQSIPEMAKLNVKYSIPLLGSEKLYGMIQEYYDGKPVPYASTP